MNKRIITVIGVSLIVLITAAYFYLGGLNSVAYTVEEVNDYNLVGIPFQGKAKSKAIEEAFFKAKDYLADGTLNGTLILVHYNDTTLADGEQKLFIGVKLEGGVANLPTEYSRITIPVQRVVRATIEAHNAVMPSPKKIEENLKQKAADLSIELQDFTIEQYVSANQLIIDMMAR